MMEADTHNGKTILDYLNAACWRKVLDYVPVRDVVGTERAGRRWQQAVLTYLRGVNMTIVEDNKGKNNNNSKVCGLKPDKYKSFESWTRKLGLSVVAVYCTSWESLETISVTCPNLETLELVNMEHNTKSRFPDTRGEQHFKRLQRLCFKSCRVSDQCVSQFVADKALEKLEFHSCNEVTGVFLNATNLSRLNTLVFEWCRGLMAEHMLSAVDQLGELTHLSLMFVEVEVIDKIQLVLDKMPKLEQLELETDNRIKYRSPEPLCRLTRLRHLRIGFQLANEDADVVTRCCKELRTLVLLNCHLMSGHGVLAICRNVGARLTALELRGFHVGDDDDLVTIIRRCPNLTSLNVCHAAWLTPAAPRRAAAAWRAGGAPPPRRLRLDLTETNLEDYNYMYELEGEEYEAMKKQHDEMRKKYESLIIVLDPQDSDEGGEDLETDDPEISLSRKLVPRVYRPD